jgi:putative Ca2+/H+ antiporter (TMEM165/GDT1 family)
MSLSFELFSSYLLTFGVIFLAEMGDKSQLVCMTLASRHRGRPVALGAIMAFSLLNLLAVTLGTSLTHFIPEQWLTYIAAGLFALFGLQALLCKEDEEEDVGEKNRKTGRNIFLTTLMMIFLAELGDKTQLAVITMGTTYSPLIVWLSATLALAATSLIGIYAGRKFLSRINIQSLHRINGLFFITLAALLLIDQF